MKIADIKIENRFRQNSKGIKELAGMIQEVGLLAPIIVDQNNELIDGERRIMAFKLLGLDDIPVRKINIHEILKPIGQIQANRNQDWTSREKVAIARFIEPREKQKTPQGKHQVLNLTHEKVRDRVAYYVKMGWTSLEKLKSIVDFSNSYKEFRDLPEQIDAGLSIDYAYKMITRAEDHKEPPELPQGEFDVIIADPPWAYDINIRGSPDEHYAIMTEKEMQELKIPVADSAILFLWATGPKLQEALRLISAWDFKYKTSAVWVKDKIGTGYYFRGQHELLLIAEKGDMPVPQEKNRPSSVIMAPRKEHSEKPKIVYELIEKMYPNRKYLELFARRQREGWTSWGK